MSGSSGFCPSSSRSAGSRTRVDGLGAGAGGRGADGGEVAGGGARELF